MDLARNSSFMLQHLQKISGGERYRRLKEGHGHAEKLFLVWWPAFGQFNHLHPEFEVSDFKDGHRYLDFDNHIRQNHFNAVEVELSLIEKEIVRLAVRNERKLIPRAVRDHCKVSDKYARKLLQILVSKGVIRAMTGSLRITSYQLLMDGSAV